MIKITGIQQVKTALKDAIERETAEGLKQHKEMLVQELSAATPVDTGYAKSRWRQEGKAIVNDADYIDRLNAGSSKQAPAYFVEATVLRHQGVLPSGTIVRSIE
jgi:hypothetical protein